jgi:hypothetical protein
MCLPRPVSGCLALASVVLAVGCGGQRSKWTFDDREAQPVRIAGSLPGIPLTSERRRDALTIARADPIVARLLAGSRFRVLETSQWGDGRTLRGAELRFVTARPIGVDADLPLADVPPDAPTKGECARPYRQTWLHETAAHVTELDILVDFGKRRVADVSTNARSGTLAWVPEKPHPSCEEIASG